MGYSDRRAAEEEILHTMLCADMMVQTNIQRSRFKLLFII